MGGQPLDEDSEEVIGVHLGQIAPDFTLLNLDGEEVSLSDYRGKNVIINFLGYLVPTLSRRDA